MNHLSAHPNSDQVHYQDLWRNARLAVIIRLIFHLGGVATVRQLARFLGVHHETVTEYVRLAHDRGYLSRPRAHGGWMLTSMALEFINPPRVAENPPFSSLTTTTTTIEENRVNQVEVEVEVAENPPFQSLEVAENPPFYDEIWSFFREIGITFNSRSDQVARMPNLTKQGVINTWEDLKSKGKAWPGLLLQILPTLTESQRGGHRDNCRCSICEGKRLARYADWEK